MLGQAKQALAGKDVQLRSLTAQRDLFKTQLAERELRVRELEASPRDAELRTKIAELEQRVSDYRRALEQRSERIAGLEAQQAQHSERIVKLEAQLAQRGDRMAELEAQLAHGRNQMTELTNALAQRDRRIRDLESDLAEGLAWGAQEREDDLKVIKGIGPKFERALKALGVKTLAQIADWSDDDIGRFSSALKVPRDRIMRGGWVEKARHFVKRSD